MRTTPLKLGLVALAALAAARAATAQDVAAFEKKVSVKALPNGLTVLVCERPEAPVRGGQNLAHAVVVGVAELRVVLDLGPPV